MSYIWDLEKHIGLGKILKSPYGEQATKDWDHFLFGELTLETPRKDFHLAIRGGLDWMKWLKNGAEKDFIFHAIFPALYISFLVKILLAK